MMARARGPGRGVLMSGAVSTFSLPGAPPPGSSGRAPPAPMIYYLFPLPPRAAGPILQQHAPRGKLVANPIGLREVTPATSRLARFYRPLDLFHRHRRPF